MGLIKGITIQLNEADGTEYTVDNALVMVAGQKQDPQAGWDMGSLLADYTISIPKDDTHNWKGARAVFFGGTWEIIAVSGMTIPHLTPLSWNRRAYVVREMADSITLRTLRGRTKGDHNIYTDDYKEVVISALLNPNTASGVYNANRDGRLYSRRVLVRQEDFNGAGTETKEPKLCIANDVEYTIDSYERIGDVVMLLNLMREV